MVAELVMYTHLRKRWYSFRHVLYIGGVIGVYHLKVRHVAILRKSCTPSHMSLFTSVAMRISCIVASWFHGCSHV